MNDRVAAAGEKASQLQTAAEEVLATITAEYERKWEIEGEIGDLLNEPL